MSRRVVAAPLRVRVWDVLERAVEEGVARGYRRAHKHTDAPDADALCEAISSAVLAEIGEWFTESEP